MIPASLLLLGALAGAVAPAAQAEDTVSLHGEFTGQVKRRDPGSG